MYGSIKIEVGHDDDSVRQIILDDLTLFARTYVMMSIEEIHTIRTMFCRAKPMMEYRHNRIAMHNAGLKRIN